MMECLDKIVIDMIHLIRPRRPTIVFTFIDFQSLIDIFIRFSCFSNEIVYFGETATTCSKVNTFKCDFVCLQKWFIVIMCEKSQ